MASATSTTGGPDAAHKRKRKYRADGSQVWSKRTVEGPGVWVSCVKGKEKQAVGEVFALFGMLADEIWPQDTAPNGLDEEDNDDATGDVEQRLAKEIAALKRPQREQRFANCQTNTTCVIFVACKPPVDPVQLIATHIENVQRTGITHTRNCHRFTPVADTCMANMPEIRQLCQRVVLPHFVSSSDGEEEAKLKYKIELRIRNHNTVTKSEVIKDIAASIPEGHTVNLDNPDLFILIEIFKSVCGMSVVRDYYKMQKFNVMELASATQMARDDV